MFEYIKVNPGISVAATLTNISVASSTSTNIAPAMALAGIAEVTSSQPRTHEELEEQEWNTIVSSPHGQRVLHSLLKEARQQIATGEFEEGGFGLE